MVIEIFHQENLLQNEDVGYAVKQIEKKETHVFLLQIHYAKRIPPISFAFGLFKNGQLLGVITYGQPASPSLCVGVCGPEYKKNVLELNRLCLLNNDKGEASRLVGKSLQLLPKPSIVVSYADTSQNHVGIVYQATNFLYTGKTKERKEITVAGLEKMHSKAISNIGTWDELVEIYGKDRVGHRIRHSKHRYVFLHGNKTQKKELKKHLRYSIEPYPRRDF